MINIDGRRVFDPDAPEFADTPLIEVTDASWTVMRGTVPEGVDIALEDVRRSGVVGVVSNNLGHVEYVKPGEEFLDPRLLSMLFELQAMLGHAETLDDVKVALHEMLDLIVEAQGRGWELHAEVTSGVWVTPAQQ